MSFSKSHTFGWPLKGPVGDAGLSGQPCYKEENRTLERLFQDICVMPPASFGSLESSLAPGKDNVAGGGGPEGVKRKWEQALQHS